RAERQKAIRAEHDRTIARSANAEQQISTLNERVESTHAELTRLAGLPEMVEQQRKLLMSQLGAAEAEGGAVADPLASADTAHREAAQVMRASQAAVSDQRENRARTEARLENARTRLDEETRKIRDQMGCAPDTCLALAEMPPESDLPSLESADAQLTRLKA